MNFQNNNNIIIWVEGCDGSGKSSLIKNICKEVKSNPNYLKYRVYSFHCPASAKIPLFTKSFTEDYSNLNEIEFSKSSEFYLIEEYFKAWNNICYQIDKIYTQNNIILLDRTPFISGLIYQFYNTKFLAHGRRLLKNKLSKMHERYYPDCIIYCNPGSETIKKNLSTTKQNNFLDCIKRYNLVFNNLWVCKYLQTSVYTFNYLQDSEKQLLENIKQI